MWMIIVLRRLLLICYILEELRSVVLALTATNMLRHDKTAIYSEYDQFHSIAILYEEKGFILARVFHDL